MYLYECDDMRTQRVVFSLSDPGWAVAKILPVYNHTELHVPHWALWLLLFKFQVSLNVSLTHGWLLICTQDELYSYHTNGTTDQYTLTGWSDQFRYWIAKSTCTAVLSVSYSTSTQVDQNTVCWYYMYIYYINQNHKKLGQLASYSFEVTANNVAQYWHNFIDFICHDSHWHETTG